MKTRKPLTPEQKAKVRSLMADEGETRAAAEAWVREFEKDAAALEDRAFFEMKGES